MGISRHDAGGKDMRISKSEIKKDGCLIATHEILDNETIIKFFIKDMGIKIGLTLDTDEALNLKHLLDIALHDKKYSWEVKSAERQMQRWMERQENYKKIESEEVNLEIEITGFYIGQVVIVTQNGEHFGKQGVIKEISDEDCLVRVPDEDREYFTNLYFDKEYLK